MELLLSILQLPSVLGSPTLWRHGAVVSQALSVRSVSWRLASSSPSHAILYCSSAASSREIDSSIINEANMPDENSSTLSLISENGPTSKILPACFTVTIQILKGQG